MKSDIIEMRHQAAKSARAVLAKEISFDDFIGRYGNSNDALIEAVIDLITHEPQRGGVLGIGASDWIRHRRETTTAIEALEHE